MTQSVGGSPPGLSRGGIQRVLRWHRALMRFRREQGTLKSFADSLGLTVADLRRALIGRWEGLGLSFEQKTRITDWKARRRRFAKRHPSAQTLARSLGVSRSTLFLCIERKGAYRTALKGDRLRPRGNSVVETNATLLRTWGRTTVDGRGEPEAQAKIPTGKRGAP
jgi:hypothetical protein